MATGSSIRISVIVAVYNTGKYLSKMLDSVLTQTFKDIEVICVDDGSTDDSLEILQEYALKDERLIVMNQPEPSDGAALARNVGLDAARGEFVMILDSDDFFESDMIEKAVKCADYANSEIVLFDGYLHDDKSGTDRETGMILRKEYLPNIHCFTPKDIRHHLFFITMGAAWNALFSRKLIDREHLRFHSFHHADDLGFVYLAFATAKRISCLYEKFVHYRVNNAGSQAANLEKWPDAAGDALTMLKKELVKRGVFETYRVAFAQLSMKYFDTYSNAIKDGTSFEDFYIKWKTKYYDSLELGEVKDEFFTQKHLLELKKALSNMTSTEYLFGKMKGMPPFDWKDKIVAEVKEGSKVILYGAGKFGTEVFSDLIRNKYYNVTGWVDQSYDTIGFPVQAPVTISNIEFDWILVAVESKSLFQRICDDTLKEMGISFDKVIWVGSGI